MYNELQPDLAEKINTDAAIAAVAQQAVEQGINPASISPHTNDPNPTPEHLAATIAEVERVFNERLQTFIDTFHRFIENTYKGSGDYHVN